MLANRGAAGNNKCTEKWVRRRHPAAGRCCGAGSLQPTTLPKAARASILAWGDPSPWTRGTGTTIRPCIRQIASWPTGIGEDPIRHESHHLITNRPSNRLSTATMVSFTPTLDCAQLAQGCGLMVSAGVATHLAYFIRGDHNLFAYRWIPRALTAIGVLGLTLLYLTRFRVLDSVVATALFTTSYFTGLYTSISTYRLFFHPLRVFPGPFWARLSNLYHAYIIRNSDNALLIQKLHQKYGPIVRTGESTLHHSLCRVMELQSKTKRLTRNTRPQQPLHQRLGGHPRRAQQ